MTQMIARFASTCAASGAKIARGDTIEYDRATKRAVLVTRAEPGSQPAPPARPSRYGSHFTRFNSGAEAYVNKRGRCEDAPCCGCCS